MDHFESLSQKVDDLVLFGADDLVLDSFEHSEKHRSFATSHIAQKPTEGRFGPKAPEILQNRPCDS